MVEVEMTEEVVEEVLKLISLHPWVWVVQPIKTHIQIGNLMEMLEVTGEMERVRGHMGVVVEQVVVVVVGLIQRVEMVV